jgi:hypothetical protein
VRVRVRVRVRVMSEQVPLDETCSLHINTTWRRVFLIIVRYSCVVGAQPLWFLDKGVLIFHTKLLHDN